jgi:hypothetical protein
MSQESSRALAMHRPNGDDTLSLTSLDPKVEQASDDDED